MIIRKIQKEINESLAQFPAVGIIGPRQIGKTTLAKQIKEKHSNSVYLDLELPSDFQKLNQAELFLDELRNKLVIIDEIHHRPELFPILRGLIDKQRKPGRFLILGSASPDLIRKSSESLAGRIIYHELTSILNPELNSPTKQTDLLWVRGGFPESFLAANEEMSLKWRNAFIQSLLERDIPGFGIKIHATQLKRFWMMLSHIHGTIWNASRLAASLGISPPTAKTYLDLLQDTFLIHQLQPYFTNMKKRLIKSPKIYVRDSGLLHSMLSLKNKEELLGHPSAGFSWEGFVVEQISGYLSEKFGKYFYRTSAGAEVDLVITRGNKVVLCIEIKLSLSPQLTQGFYNAMGDLKCNLGVVVYPGKDAYPISDNVRTIPFVNIFEFLDQL